MFFDIAFYLAMLCVDEPDGGIDVSISKPRSQAVPAEKARVQGVVDQNNHRVPKFVFAPRSVVNSADAAASAPPLHSVSGPFAFAEETSGVAPADFAQTRKKSLEPEIFNRLRNSKSESIPPEVRKLSEDITRDCTNELQKARAIYDWITSNIKYDSEEWSNIVSGADDYAHDHSPAAVIERGSTVCIGYSWLFDALCSSAGLESTFLIGDVRGYRGTEDDALVSNIKHAWSAVKIDGEWGLLDATWGAIQEGESKEEAAGRAEYYFLTPPSQMIFDHLPESDEWQLLNEPFDQKTAFSILPNIKPSFFLNDLKLGSDYTSNLKAVADRNTGLMLSAPDDVEIMATVCSESDSSKNYSVPVLRRGNAVAVGVPGQNAGARTILRIYSRKGELQPFSCSADFMIVSE